MNQVSPFENGIHWCSAEIQLDEAGTLFLVEPLLIIQKTIRLPQRTEH